ncbi:Dehydrogenase RED2 [Fusarium oxysporum f. sp. cubense]|uniref:Dehydrogenase RED2 n=1 Tax=Fusarium oxysporum f. sp. cubense TaxID=61366 RepID=A0A559LAX2_FUSOC|nr:Dehydrogenase RED2 [Fusarium oxysporum f. sp. cubense]
MDLSFHGLEALIRTGTLASTVPPKQARITLGTLGALGIILTLNQLLNRVALHNSLWNSSWDWRREIVLVTGGSSGLGDLVVSKLAKKSIKVVNVDINPPKDTASSQYVGEPTVLVNNAGTGTMETILQGTEEETRRTFGVNILALFSLARAFIPSMIERNHGHVITIASMASFITIPSNVDYSCTKAAALAFHEGLAQELKHRYSATNVKTSIIHPTFVRTPLLEEHLQKGPFKDQLLDPNMVTDAIVAQILRGKSG